MSISLMLPAPWREPVEVLSAFAEEPWVIGFLSDGSPQRGRWSYLARQPDATVLVPADEVGDPFARLSQMLGETTLSLPDGPPFQGGIAGLATYEFGDRIEALALKRQAAWPDLAVGRYSSVLAFDHQDRRVCAIGRGADAAEARRQAQRALDWLALTPRAVQAGALASDVVGCSAQAYERAVAEVVARIEAGDIFQANIARSWRGRMAAGATPFDLLARLVSQSAAPFAAYFRLADRAVVSNSPERFLQLSADGRVEARPVKGTAPRGLGLAHDVRLARDLSASTKDRAENLMIVDLMRNDLARVCRPGSVKVPELWSVETFTNVHHLVSSVVGQLQAGKTAIDLLRAAFPPGSITGAPKVAAMKTIAQLESPRGPYCGTLFWAGFDGAFDSSVLIRTVVCMQDDAGWAVEARAGAGIVADSDPKCERMETEAKISAILHALEGAT